MRRIVLALLALVVLLPSLAQARARWLTDVDVYFRDECCCPPNRAQPARRRPKRRPAPYEEDREDETPSPESVD